MSNPYAIEARQLVKVFNQKKEPVKALAGLSLRAEQGTVLGVLGPNGAGKTTAVRVLSTIIKPDSGEAFIMGKDVVKHPDQVRLLIGLAGQFATVDENLTGGENLWMIGRLNHLSRKVTRSRTTELLEQFGLEAAANRPLKTYSGGMRRRLDLAAALVAMPPVLFLDEPTTGLDPQGRQDMWVATEELVRQGVTVLLTTQYLEEADRLAQQIVVVDQGKVIAQGTPAELKADMGATAIWLTVGNPQVALQVSEILRESTGLVPTVDGSTVGLTVDNGPKVAAEVLRTLDHHQIPVGGLELREPSLDDVFLKLTGHHAEAVQ